MGIINNKKVMQTPKKPNARVGDNQATRVPTHEGSLLGTPKTAKITASKTPHL